MMEDEEQEELRCTTGSDVEIEEYTDTEESPYAAYQAGGDKLFDADREDWQKLRFLLTLASVAVSVTVLVISYPLYLESVGTVSSAYAGREFRSRLLSGSSIPARSGSRAPGTRDIEIIRR